MGLTDELVKRAREAAARSEWREAHDLLTEADTNTPLTGPDLALLADVAYAAGHLDVTIAAWERAHAQSMRAGDHLAAAGAAVRVAMHLVLDTALMAPVRGWISRADRLLEGHDETPVHAWMAVARTYERLLSGDFQRAGEWARRAIEIGSKHEPAAAAVGRVAEARSLILAGDVSHGLELLNEAGVAAVSGELDPLFTGVVYCELVCAFQALAQYDLAEEWTAAMERWCQGRNVGSIHGRCRVHHAEILRLRGSCVEAEREALLACEELRPYLRRELGWPLTELGRIRLRRGDIQGADEAFRAAQDAGWDPQPGPALVHLARGDVATAARSIRDALDRPLNIPSKELPPNTELRRAPLLAAQVEIEVAAGDLDLARAAANDLAGVAARFESKALRAGAAFAQGSVRLAEGDAAGARGDFETAARLWDEIGAPYEAALARTGLARAHRAEPNEERPASRPAARPRAAEENVFRREGDYWSVTFQGHTTRLRDLKGLRYLARLLADPGRDVHVLDLVAVEMGRSVDASRGAEDRAASASGMDAGALLDSQAREAYRRRLTEIDEDLEEARSLGDHDRAAQAEGERDFLVRELARAVGLGGRDRRAASASERARASVTRAVRQAMARIRERHPALGEHLGRAIRTGTYCAYLPDPRVPPAWKL